MWPPASSDPSRSPVPSTTICGAAGGLALAAPPSGRRLRSRVVGRRAARSAPGASRSARRRPRTCSGSSQTTTGRSSSEKTEALRGRTIGATSLPAGKRLARAAAGRGRECRPARISSASSASSSRDFWYSVSGSSVQSSTFRTERCDSTSKRRMDSTWSPNRSMRTGFGDSGEKTSRMPPRTEYSPTISTGSRRS